MGVLSVIEDLTHRALAARGVESRWVDTSIARLHAYHAKGRGPLGTVAVLHGISSSAAAYGSLIQRLRGRFHRVVAPDAPGHGRSGDPRVPLNPETLLTGMAELLDRELSEPSVVFGCSLGGAVAVSYALARPEKVRALILASPAGAAMDAAELERFLTIFRMKSKSDAADFLGRLHRRAPWYTPFIASDLVDLFARPVITSFTESVRSEHLFTPEQLASLPMPVHLLWGRADRLMPGSSLDFYRRHLPSHATIEEPDRWGHCPHFDDPAALAKKIAEFARRADRFAR
ncbi:MAG: alpha/beta hydrolase [Polyangiaceae bacterium]|nr:alpha/beta hydrolase [Polyangiaceae bacterium]NUQ76659.1 alpha/beta hydrolase [Polyangiaceae bacterium]